MTKRYYIAGPITGEESEDVQLSFYRMERRLLDSGFKVYNPAALPEGLDWGTYMQMALAVLCSDLFDGIIMLRGWSRSKGAQIEWLAAQAIGIPIFYEDNTAKAERKALATAIALLSADAVSGEEYEETDGVINIKKQRAKDVGKIKHIVVCSPNYTRYFYNESMQLPSAEAIRA